MKTVEELKNDDILKEHNISTYQEVQELFDKGEKRVGVVQATGTGKSYLALQFLYDNVLTQEGKRAIILDPLYGVVKQFKELFENEYYQKYIQGKHISLDNVLFSHYDQLKTLTDEEIKLLDFDYIVLDEFHGLGADGRGGVTQKLLQANPNAKVLGLSATPIRYLDKNRDMGDELFGDNIVKGMNVSNAIREGVLPEPDYVMAVYSYADTINEIEEKIKRVKDKKRREAFEKDIEKARKRAESADGLSEVLTRKIKNPTGKFIAFCPNTERLYALKEEIKKGMFAGVNKKVKIYQITYKDGKNNANDVIKKFEEDKSDSLKIMLAVDMFNEGIHVKDVDGCLLFRPTISPRIYLQQIGRVLSVREDKDFHPLIFDVVNNIKCFDKIVESFEVDDEELNCNYNHNRTKNIFLEDESILPFKIDGNDLELNRFLLELDNMVSQTIVSSEQWLAAAERYAKKFGNLNMSTLYVEEETELSIGRWIGNTRLDYIKDPKLVKENVAKKLLELDEHVFEYGQTERFNRIIEDLTSFTKEFGEIPVPSECNKKVGEKYKFLCDQCDNIRGVIAGNTRLKYTPELIAKIKTINPNALKSRKERNAERNEQTLKELKMFVKEFGKIPVPTDPKKAGEKYKHLWIQCKNIKRFVGGTGQEKYEQEFIDKILEINPNAIKTQAQILKDRDEQIIKDLKSFVAEFGKVPVLASVSPNLDDKYKSLISHCDRIKRFIKGCKSVKYDKNFIDKILEINPDALKTNEELLKERDEQIIEDLKMFVEEFGQIPVPGDNCKTLAQKYRFLSKQCTYIKGVVRGYGPQQYDKKLIDKVLEINPKALGNEKTNNKDEG